MSLTVSFNSTLKNQICHNSLYLFHTKFLSHVN
nr:MAG TPA: hypothetical protein [Caudoviricetes sp.]